MFWQEKTLAEMDNQEWESLCDGCGQCCVWKFEDEDSHEILYTDIRCQLFDPESCRCKDYDKRFSTVPDCMKVRSLQPRQYSWLPATCAYRLLHEGKSLFDWHHLISGEHESVHQAGISLRGKTVCGEGFGPEDYARHIIDPGSDQHE